MGDSPNSNGHIRVDVRMQGQQLQDIDKRLARIEGGISTAKWVAGVFLIGVTAASAVVSVLISVFL